MGDEDNVSLVQVMINFTCPATITTVTLILQQLHNKRTTETFPTILHCGWLKSTGIKKDHSVEWADGGVDCEATGDLHWTGVNKQLLLNNGVVDQAEMSGSQCISQPSKHHVCLK